MKLFGNIVARLCVPVVLINLAACGESGVTNIETSSPDTLSEHSADRNIVVRLETAGGLVAPDFHFRTLPSLVIYADGLVITQGPQIAIYPAPALPSLVVRRLDAAGLAAVKKVITGAGLVTASPPGYAAVPIQIADGPTTTLVVTFDGITATHAAYALGMGQTAETGARKTLADVVARLEDLGSLVGAEHIGPEAMFAPTRFAIRTSPSEADPSSPVVDWPLVNVALGAAAECLVVDDPAAPALFASMTTATRVRQAVVIYSIAVRPVLPAETGCGTGG
ncbi:MAG: hypothetical protein ABJD24_00420 [Acidimicrobiales bacterium]